MVKQMKKGIKTFYLCEECEFVYGSKNLAQKCQEWCNKHHSCNIEITKHAVKID